MKWTKTVGKPIYHTFNGRFKIERKHGTYIVTDLRYGRIVSRTLSLKVAKLQAFPLIGME